MQDLITVIIPVYKVENYIDKCIESVLTQSYENLEIILVDDGSPDRCGEICDEYSKKDSRIRVIHKENGGLSSARNAALDVMTGKWVMCVDSDDYVHRDIVKRLYDAVVRNEADIAICSHYQEKADTLSIVERISDEENIYNSMDALQKLVQDDEIKNYAWGKLYRAELFEGIRYPNGRNYEDIATTYYLFDKADRIVKIPCYMYYYLIRDDSISFNRSRKMWHKGCHASCLGQQERCAYFKGKGYDELYKLAQAKLLPYLFSDITSGYSDSAGDDIIVTQDYLRKNKDEFLANPHISIKDKRLIDIYLKSEKQYKLYSQNKNRVGHVFKLVKKSRQVVQRVLYNEGFTLEGQATRRIVYFELPCFDNLGDHAIAYATKKYLEDFCRDHPQYQLFVVTAWKFNNAYSALRKCIQPGDVIICQGGGNFGSLYEFAEVYREKVFKGFYKNRIILMPQTCYFSADEEGKEALAKDRQVINRCKDLTLFARDARSYEFMKENFDAKVAFLHDTVSLFDASEYSAGDREGIIVCLRSDREGILNATQKKQIIADCENLGDVFVTDTCTNYKIGVSERESILKKKWTLWGRSSLVVTDRLHGMIFALITGTPCVVIGNNHFKVYEAYKTFKECKYLTYIDEICKLPEAAKILISADYDKPQGSLYKEDIVNLYSTIIKED